MFGPVTLHEEMADILREHGSRWMTTQEIADEVNLHGRYRKRDGSRVTAFQIFARARQYSGRVSQHRHLFELDGSLVRLIGP